MYLTKKRPPTEPYDIWRKRREIQRKEIKQYLKGRPFWTSCIIVPLYAKGDIYKVNPVCYKKIPVEGTYVAPICPLCNKKEKKCDCLKTIRK